jgi:hypothetical protein
MQLKGILVTLLIVAALGGLFAVSSFPTQAADPPREATAEVGRYQLIQDKNGDPKYLFDTASGRIWLALSREWKEYIEGPKIWTPPPPPGKLGPRLAPP